MEIHMNTGSGLDRHIATARVVIRGTVRAESGVIHNELQCGAGPIDLPNIQSLPFRNIEVRCAGIVDRGRQMSRILLYPKYTSVPFHLGVDMILELDMVEGHLVSSGFRTADRIPVIIHILDVIDRHGTGQTAHDDLILGPVSLGYGLPIGKHKFTGKVPG